VRLRGRAARRPPLSPDGEGRRGEVVQVGGRLGAGEPETDGLDQLVRVIGRFALGWVGQRRRGI
jgi:hypothetical protein